MIHERIKSFVGLIFYSWIIMEIFFKKIKKTLRTRKNDCV